MMDITPIATYFAVDTMVELMGNQSTDEAQKSEDKGQSDFAHHLQQFALLDMLMRMLSGGNDDAFRAPFTPDPKAAVMGHALQGAQMAYIMNS